MWRWGYLNAGTLTCSNAKSKPVVTCVWCLRVKPVVKKIEKGPRSNQVLSKKIPRKFMTAARNDRGEYPMSISELESLAQF